MYMGVYVYVYVSVYVYMREGRRRTERERKMDTETATTRLYEQLPQVMRHWSCARITRCRASNGILQFPRSGDVLPDEGLG